MPEMPEIEAYRAALEPRVLGRRARAMDLHHPFLLRSASPAIGEFVGRRVEAIRRIGKRIVFGFEGEHFAVLHLMVAGRLHWLAPGAALHKTRTLMAWHFDEGILQLTEAGKKRRASLHLEVGEAALGLHDPGGSSRSSAAETPSWNAFVKRTTR